MSDLTFGEILKTAEDTPEGLRFSVTDNWKQGRTAYGGFTSGLLLAAARRAMPDLPPLRSVLINFTGPVATPPTVSTRILRQGRNVITVQAEAFCEDKLCAQGTFSFGQAQESHISHDLSAPDAPSPDEVEDFLPPNIPLPINFFKNFDAKLIEGHRPFSGADRGYIRAWVQHRDEEVRQTPEGLISLADVLPPAVFSKARKLGPNSSMNWICNFLSEDLTSREGWWMIETDLTVARDGYSSQVMRMWNADGELVVDGMQSVVIFV
ncbi:thioesterase family protein [Tropicibacter sp. Alg240-R139]|uniref:thioesterase family protein n=1 Tax=Tropicibacter sp. Alg240-R139 TaxID=2305991 RepID=UPI0013E06416|nr:thioesterase family protein [Tropicibacter sp. Alg240-R139]